MSWHREDLLLYCLLKIYCTYKCVSEVDYHFRGKSISLIKQCKNHGPLSVSTSSPSAFGLLTLFFRNVQHVSIAGTFRTQHREFFRSSQSLDAFPTEAFFPVQAGFHCMNIFWNFRSVSKTGTFFLRSQGLFFFF